MTLDLAKLRADTLALIDGTTPGPWHQANGSEIHDRSVRFGAQGERLGDTPMLIAEAYAPRAGTNARLIAAAPTLAADNLRLVDDNLRLLDEIERLRGLIAGAVGIFENCSVETGVCCCGDNMEGHPSPMNCGHTPTDMGGYQALQWLDAARAALPEGGSDAR